MILLIGSFMAFVSGLIIGFFIGAVMVSIGHARIEEYEQKR